MSTARPFAYNPSLTPIEGTIQVGDLAVGFPTSGFTDSPQFWNGPDEELGYVIVKPISGNTQPTPVLGNNIYLSPTYRGTDINLSNNNQTAYQQFGYQQSVLGVTPIGSGDTSMVMFSVLCTLADPPAAPDSHVIGIGYTTMNYQGNPYGGYPGNDGNSMGYGSNGVIWYNGSVYATGLQTWTNNDIIDIVINNNINAMWVRVNGGDWNNNPSDNPVTNTGGFEIIGGPFYPVLCPAYEGTMIIQNKPSFGVPSGYLFLGNVLASVGFNRSELNDVSFIDLTNSLFNQSFTTALDASTWLTNNGYWNSYPLFSPVLSLDAGNPLSYPGTGTVWTDLIGGKAFDLINGPTYNSSNGGKFYFTASSSQYAICSTSLPSLSTWSVGVWHYYDGTNTGGSPCIVTETFVGGGINYSLGQNVSSDLTSGFFDGGWRVTNNYILTPGKWYYIVGTYDGTSNKLYINGNIVSDVPYVGTPTTSGVGIRLMERWDSADYWGGYLATVDIFDIALSDSEILTTWDSTKSRFGFPPPLTIATNSGGGLNGWNPTAFDISPNPDVGTTYPVGSRITFQNGEVRTMTQVDDYGYYMDVFYDSPISSSTLFPITIDV